MLTAASVATGVHGAARARLGLRHIVHRQHAVQHRHAGVERHLHEPARRRLGHEPEVLGVTADDDAEREHRIEAPRAGGPRGGHRQLETPRHPGQLHVLVARALAAQRVERGVHQAPDECLVPARGDHGERRPAALNRLPRQLEQVSELARLVER